MKKIINITNLNTNEISSIGAGLGISQNNAVMKLAQSTVNEFKGSMASLVGIAKIIPVNSIVVPVLSFFAGSFIKGMANKRKCSGELMRQSAYFEKLSGMQ